MENAMEPDNLLDYKPTEEEEEESSVVVEEVEVEAVKEKHKRLRRGRALLRKKKKREQQEEKEKDEEDVEIPDMVTARSSEWKEMKRTMQDTVDRLAQSRARIREH